MKKTIIFIAIAMLLSGSAPVVSHAQLVTGPVGGQAAYVGGMNLLFKPADQVVGETTATLKGTVSVQIGMPVQLRVYSGVNSNNLDQLYTPTLMPPVTVGTSGLAPGEVKTFDIPFTGLVKGTTYYFLIKNTATGTQSPVWNFTTKGGTTPIPQSATTVYDSQTNPYANPGTGAPVIDTISDKGIVPQCGRSQNAKGTVPVEQTAMCTKKDFMQLIANVIQYFLIIIGPIIAVVVMFSGAMVLWLNYQSDPTNEIQEQKKKYIGILTRAAVGLFIVMIAWVLVATIIKALGVKPEFVLLDVLSG